MYLHTGYVRSFGLLGQSRRSYEGAKDSEKALRLLSVRCLIQTGREAMRIPHHETFVAIAASKVQLFLPTQATLSDLIFTPVTFTCISIIFGLHSQYLISPRHTFR